MKIVHVKDVEEAVRKLAIDVNYYIGDKLKEYYRRALEEEVSEIGREIISQIIENAELAAREQLPVCQDTGVSIVYIQMG
ncbi:MAG: fumarate hydratase, partial [Nitrososphaerota archaeon]